MATFWSPTLFFFSKSFALFIFRCVVYLTLFFFFLQCNKIEVCQRTYNRLQPRHITKFHIDYNSNYFLTTRSLTYTYSARHHSFKYNFLQILLYIGYTQRRCFYYRHDNVKSGTIHHAIFISIFYYLFLFLSYFFRIFIISISYNISSALPLSYLFLCTIQFFVEY